MEFRSPKKVPGLTRNQLDSLLGIMRAGLDAVEPRRAVRRHVVREDDTLHVEGHTYDLSQYDNVYVVGAGKAGAAMATAVEGILQDRLSRGIIIVKHGYTERTRSVVVHEGGHPVPDPAGLAGARRITDLLTQTTERDLVIALISGGGSALLVKPVEGIKLRDLQALTGELLASGATINEINAVRKHLSAVKGGQLARLAAPAEVLTLILSDVVGNPLDVIASGPTVADESSYATARQVLEHYDLWEVAPQAVRQHLQAGLRGDVDETPKPGDPIFERVVNVIVGDNPRAAQAAAREAGDQGYHTLILSTYVEGEAREVAKVFAAIAREVARYERPAARPACIIAGGETTVTLQGTGKGGRNMELALAAAPALRGTQGAALAALATDGTDGPTDAAGAVVTGATVDRAHELGLNPSDYLRRSDSYHFFERLDSLLVTGPTNTNVNDLTFVLVFD